MVEKSIIDTLLDKGFITEEDVHKARLESQELGITVEEWLVSSNVITKNQLGAALSAKYETLYLDSDLIGTLLDAQNIRSGDDLAKLVGKPLNDLAALMRNYNVLPLDDNGTSIRLAVVPPVEEASLVQIESYFGKPLELAVTTSQDLEEVFRSRLLNFGLGDTERESTSAQRRKEVQINASDLITAEATAEGVFNTIAYEAVSQEATDIHLVADDDKYIVRFRKDGILYDAHNVPRGLGEAIVTRVKVLAEMDIAEKRKPQDGQMIINVEGHSYNIRVASVGSNYGESLFLRILYKRKFNSSLDELGMLPEQVQIVKASITKPYGIIVTTGPTGSGKTTTLYAMIREILDQGMKNIITIEDPIEYDFSGITQIQVNIKADITFSGTLRAVMRQDPDIILVGEIRDEETLHTAISAALSGHLVLSTLHANNAVSAIARLLSMGGDPVLLSSSLTTVMAQRLIRVWDKRIRDYKGRIGVFEVLPITPELQRLIAERKDIRTLEDESKLVSRFMTMEEIGHQMVEKGMTSPEEYYRVFGYDLTEVIGAKSSGKVPGGVDS